MCTNSKTQECLIQVIITGTGTAVVTGTDSIEVQTTVTANEINSIIIN